MNLFVYTWITCNLFAYIIHNCYKEGIRGNKSWTIYGCCRNWLWKQGDGLEHCQGIWNSAQWSERWNGQP
jgi:hypothetical protein